MYYKNKQFQVILTYTFISVDKEWNKYTIKTNLSHITNSHVFNEYFYRKSM